MATSQRTMASLSRDIIFTREILPQIRSSLFDYMITGDIKYPELYTSLMHKVLIGSYSEDWNSSATRIRHVLFAKLLKKFPRLAVCGVTFARLTVYHNHIVRHLTNDNILARGLARPVHDSPEDLIDFSD